MSTMTLANIGPTVSEPDGCEVWPWYEFGLFVADSEGILADALTPQAVVLLTLVDTDRLGSPPPLPASAQGWTPLPAPPPGRPRAKQRSPPEQGGSRVAPRKDAEPQAPDGIGGFSRSAWSMAAGETHLVG
ncbi:hypothetical protein [Rhodococcus sp. JS3073]|uniref:hypothetical protein n=1 Tax=Rhodococcus sp. JS3073 TaxID=3002901 RepID=UPI0022865BFE|nr:hypothetical protein [Rhodococcus sp. JS3073]WAM19332.1 hypothetical protein OYT95_43345 [Rhodococcus sp. JS3073]WAM19346.1 hypothetical protein OYT95_43440 [Rhodococcus sp. JS3073]